MRYNNNPLHEELFDYDLEYSKVIDEDPLTVVLEIESTIPNQEKWKERILKRGFNIIYEFDYRDVYRGFSIIVWIVRRYGNRKMHEFNIS